MARARNIKPGFFKNYDLADLGSHVQLLFAGLWCLADREGRLEDKPRFIKAELFPYYEVDVNGGLTLLNESGFVKRYSVGGVALIQVEGFKKHQSPHQTEKLSVLPGVEQAAPAIPCPAKVTVDQPLNNVDSPKHVGGNPPDSLIHRFSDSLIPDSLIQPRKPKLDEAVAVDSVALQAAGEIEGQASAQPSLIPDDPTAPTVTTKAKPSASDAAFDAAWAIYPKRAGGNSRSEALKAWNARIRQGKRPEDMAAGVRRYAAFCEAKGNIGTEYVKQASTFFGPSNHFDEDFAIPVATARPQGGGFMTTQERNRVISEANMAAFMRDEGMTPFDDLRPPEAPLVIDME